MTCRRAQPSHAFQLLSKLLTQSSAEDYFIVTQNEHGLLTKTGIPDDKIWETNGNINFFQSEDGKIFPNDYYTYDPEDPTVTIPTSQGESPGAVRPNILLFNDSQWNSERSDAQESKFKAFMKQVK